jgi:hypothetical protein
MGQTTDQIENHIASRREDLQSNLQELETKVTSATDWRHHFRKHTGLAIAAAFGGGILLSTLLAKARVRASAASTTASGTARSQTSAIRRESPDTWDGIKGALLGVTAAGIKEMLAVAVPRLSELLTNSAGSRGDHSADRGSRDRNH